MATLKPNFHRYFSCSLCLLLALLGGCQAPKAIFTTPSTMVSSTGTHSSATLKPPMPVTPSPSAASTHFEPQLPVESPEAFIPNPFRSLEPELPEPVSETPYTGPIEKVSAQIQVYDDLGNPLPNTTIHLRSLNQVIPLETSVQTNVVGYYLFKELPSGVQLAFSASKPGFVTRRRVEVLKSEQLGMCNCYAFGEGPLQNGGYFPPGSGLSRSLSQRPEVMKVQPLRRGMLSQADEPFVLSFSQPMIQSSVEDNFQVQVLTGSTLSIAETLTGASNSTRSDGKSLYDTRSFETSWNAEKTEVSFRFKPGWQLLVDRDFTRTPIYQVSLRAKDGIIRAENGLERATEPFKLTEGNFEADYAFIPQADLSLPRLERVVPDSDGLGLKLGFSEAMRIQTLIGSSGAGPANLNEAPAAFNERGITGHQAAENYFISLRRQGQLQMDRVSWASLNGTAELDSAQPDNRTISLRVFRQSGSEPLFQSGDELMLEVAASIKDPAGNPVSESHRIQRLIIN